MPTKSERQALAFFGIVALLGAGVRLLRSDPPPVPSVEERLALASQLAATDSAAGAAAERKAGKGRRPRRPKGEPAGGPESRAWEKAPVATRPSERHGDLAPATPAPASPEPVNPDQATAAELERLPWVGPALAARIVADREAHGPFGSIEGLERVRGIGPKLVERLRPLVTFAGPGRPRNAAPGGAVTRAGERPWVPAGSSPRP
jgi:competence protein ComEA